MFASSIGLDGQPGILDEVLPMPPTKLRFIAWLRRAVPVTLVAGVARADFELRKLDIDLEIAKRTLASREKSLRLTRARQEQGEATGLDIRQAESLRYTTAARISDLERRIRQRENKIRLLLVLPPGDMCRGLPVHGACTPVRNCRWAAGSDELLNIVQLYKALGVAGSLMEAHRVQTLPRLLLSTPDPNHECAQQGGLDGRPPTSP